MKLSPAQRVVLASALEVEQEEGSAWVHEFFRDCVYARNLRGLIRIGAVEQDLQQRFRISDAGREAMS